MFKFGSATREGESFVCSAEGGTVSKGSRDNPGPGSYKDISSLGGQKLSTNTSSATTKFGSSLREDETKHKFAPGPGAYSCHDSVGAQKLSKRQSSPAYGFGTSQRSPLVAEVG
jgi:hypothetical protein